MGVDTSTWDMQDILAPLLKLFEDKDVQARMMDAVETARIYYTSDDVTVNLVWSILILGVLLLLLKPLLGIPLLDNILGAMTGSSPSYGSGISSDYGAPDSGYGAPDAGYGAPDAGYAAPAGGAGYEQEQGGSEYGAPSSGYDTPDAGYSAPQSGYSRGRRAVTLTDEQKSVYSNAINSLPPVSSLSQVLTHRFALPAQAQALPSLDLIN